MRWNVLDLADRLMAILATHLNSPFSETKFEQFYLDIMNTQEERIEWLQRTEMKPT